MGTRGMGSRVVICASGVETTDAQCVQTIVCAHPPSRGLWEVRLIPVNFNSQEMLNNAQSASDSRRDLANQVADRGPGTPHWTLQYDRQRRKCYYKKREAQGTPSLFSVPAVADSATPSFDLPPSFSTGICCKIPNFPGRVGI